MALLLTLNAQDLPREHGVYVVVRQDAGQPEFLPASRASKHRDHTVTISWGHSET